VIIELEEIKRLLLQEWDPIGISNVPEARDEYDSYALQVLSALQSGANAASISDFLERVVTDRMGLSSNQRHSDEIASKLVAMHQDRIGE
jgi:hypothetical protein